MQSPWDPDPVDKPNESASRHTSPNLLQLLTAAQLGAPDAIERLLAHTEGGIPLPEAPVGTELLVFLCGSAPCAAPLSVLREVLPALPVCAALPASPAWMLGVFSLRAELLGLVDPAPYLFGVLDDAAYTPMLATRRQPHGSLFPAPPTGPLGLTMAIIAGEGERSLGLAVSAVGDLVRAGEDEINADPSALAQAASPIVERYIVGIYTPHDTSDHYTVLAVERLVDDLLRAVDAGEEDPYG
jgi:chemotaxis signal transduction protein